MPNFESIIATKLKIIFKQYSIKIYHTRLDLCGKRTYPAVSIRSRTNDCSGLPISKNGSVNARQSLTRIPTAQRGNLTQVD